MKSKVLSGSSLLVGLCLMLGSCLNDDSISGYQQLQEDIAEIDSYLASNPPDPSDVIVRDASGIRLVITEQGTGEIPPTAENTIHVAYAGMILRNGEISEPFEETLEGNPYTFTLTTADAKGKDVIIGWKNALYMMTEGTHARVYIPSGLAYGPNGSDKIPDNAILVFDLELVVVNTDDETQQLAKDEEKISLYVDFNSIQNVQVDPSGLQYVIKTPGSGATPGLYDQVRLRVTGKIMDVNETVFADNVLQGPVDKQFSSRVVNYIHGLIIGMQKMKAGGKATFYIPSALGFGPSAISTIPGNSVLIYDVELLEVIPNEE